jgi:hypothetical protein
VRRAIAQRLAGVALADIAEAHGRTKRAIQKVLWKHRILLPRPPKPPPAPLVHEQRLAREALAWELAVARSERATAPLLRSWPAGVWP